MELALSLPEIRGNICRFLSLRDHKTCALVSRVWAESVIPWIWYSVIHHPGGPPEKLAVLHKHSASVRVLKVGKHRTLIDIYEWFENLQVLHFIYLNYQTEILEYAADLIRRNRFSLRRIHFHFSANKDSAVFREALLCPLLKHLSFNNVAIQEQDLMESFIKTCTRLTTLSLKNVTFEETVHLMFSGQAFTNLEQVKMEYVRGPYLDILRACQNLKALTIIKGDPVSASSFLEVITVHCRQLCVFSYSDCGLDNDGDFEKIAMALPPMKRLQGSTKTIRDFISSSVYSRHFENLQAIQLHDFLLDDGTNSQMLLSSCPNLRSCVGVLLNAEDIESGPPWVCQRLEHLEAQIMVHPEREQLHLVVCRQLSQLKELRILRTDMEWWSFGTRSHTGILSLRLGEGLELLASLSKLEYFNVGLLREEWRSEEVEWMTQAWPNLVFIYYDFNEEDGVYPQGCKQMDSLGFKLLTEAYEWLSQTALHFDFVTNQMYIQKYTLNVIVETLQATQLQNCYHCSNKDAQTTFSSGTIFPSFVSIAFNIKNIDPGSLWVCQWQEHQVHNRQEFAIRLACGESRLDDANKTRY
ncbi:hypothetical protein BGW38_009047 [Lunasporangiospora selenospora]|uniref:F-box domain-containing protein n=1 Tax=Lunasporangiospora selenospora TaxID=979761 RepID=A0A9P6FY93_9FUNG|nr:hypothetical protein BGW38_009047 [Lunasporangiospora selenospora]